MLRMAFAAPAPLSPRRALRRGERSRSAATLSADAQLPRVAAASVRTASRDAATLSTTSWAPRIRHGLLERGVGVGAAPVRGSRTRREGRRVRRTRTRRRARRAGPPSRPRARSQRGVGRVARGGPRRVARASSASATRLVRSGPGARSPRWCLVRGHEVEDAVQPGGLRGDGRGRQLKLWRRGGARRSGRDRHGDGGHRASHSEQGPTFPDIYFPRPAQLFGDVWISVRC